MKAQSKISIDLGQLQADLRAKQQTAKSLHSRFKRADEARDRAFSAMRKAIEEAELAKATLAQATKTLVEG